MSAVNCFRTTLRSPPESGHDRRKYHQTKPVAVVGSHWALGCATDVSDSVTRKIKSPRSSRDLFRPATRCEA